MVAGVIVLWRFQVCHSYHTLWGACCSSALNHTFPMQCTALRVGPARTPAANPNYSARVLDFDSLALSMSSGHRPFHGHPLLFMGVRGRTEVRNLNRQWWAYCFSSSRLLSAGCRGGACICTVGTVRSGSLQRGRRLSCVGGRAVRPSKLLPVQFKKLSQTVRPFIRECILYYGVYNSGFVCKSGPIHLPGATLTKSRTSMKLVQASRVPLT